MPQRENRTTLSLPADVTRKTRARAISEGTTMTAVVTALLRGWLVGEIDLPQPTEPKPKAKAKRGQAITAIVVERPDGQAQAEGQAY
jgi:hypothetical protein